MEKKCNMENHFTVIAILVLFCTVIQGNDIDNNKSSLFLIPIKPLHYNVYIDIALEIYSFSGNVEINFQLLSNTDNITLHASQLHITHVAVFRKKEKCIIDKTGTNNDTVYMVFNPPLDSGVYTIKMSYKGNFNTSTMGLYAIDYEIDDLGYPRYATVTYFQPRYARNVFPCFDDPKLKAKFNISIGRHKDDVAISNMPLKLSKDMGNNQVLDVFEVTPKLSTNQVAFAVFNYPEPTSYRRGNIYVTDMPDNNYLQRSYLREVSEGILREIDSFFHMPSPMKKIDIMVVRDLPRNDGGMANWGLIFLSEDLFHNNKMNKIMEKQDTLMTLTHVYLHGLLGHVCNEAQDGCFRFIERIAMFLQYTIGDQFRPDWRLLEQRALILLRDSVEMDYAVFYDTLVAKKYLEEDFKTQLDKPNYKKDAAIMLTLQNMVRRHNFQLGLQHFAYRSMDMCSFGGTVTPNDFWVSLQEVVDNEKFRISFTPSLKIKNIAKIMKAWDQPGVIPVLDVRRNYTAPFGIKFSQYPLLDHNLNESKPWYIPINYATSSKPLLFNVLSPIGGFLEPSKPYTFPTNVRHDEWLIINIEAAYLYLVNYDDTNWKRLASALNSENFGNIPPLTRGKLLYDAFTLAMFGRLKYSVALEMLKYLWREKDYIPLNSLFHVLESFYSRFAGIDDFHYLEEFLAKALQPALEYVGYQENQTSAQHQQHIDNLNRLQIIKWACRLGNQFCRTTTTQMLEEKFDLLPHDLKEVVVCGGLIDADTTIWDKLVSLNGIEEDEAIINGFGCSQNRNKLIIYIEDNIKYHVSIFHKIYPKGYFGINFVLNYLVHNWKMVYDSLEESDKKDLIHGIARYITMDVQLSMLQSISTNLTMPELNDTFEQAINKAKQRISWVKIHSGDITEWIRKSL